MGKKSLIKDEQRRKFLEIVYHRIRNGRSTLLIGKYGSGKTTLLQQIRPQKTVVWIESLSRVDNIVSQVLTALDVPHKATPINLIPNLFRIGDNAKRVVLIIDEAGDLRPTALPYLKRIMNYGVPVVLAGLPDFRHYLKERAADVLSRCRELNLDPIEIDEFLKFWPEIDEDAMRLIYGAGNGNMRAIDEIVSESLHQKEESKLDRVNLELVSEILYG